MWSYAGSSGASGERARCPAKISGMRWMGMKGWWRREELSAIRKQGSRSKTRKAKFKQRESSLGAVMVPRPPLRPANALETRKRLTQRSQRALRSQRRETQDPGTHSVAGVPGKQERKSQKMNTEVTEGPQRYRRRLEGIAYPQGHREGKNRQRKKADSSRKRRAMEKSASLGMTTTFE